MYVYPRLEIIHDLFSYFVYKSVFYGLDFLGYCGIMINFSVNTPKHSIWTKEALVRVNSHTSSCAFTSYLDLSLFFKRSWLTRSQCFFQDHQWSDEIFSGRV